MAKFSYIFLFFTVLCSTAYTLPNSGLRLGAEVEPDIVIHNRVLTTINQKPITVLDLVKKMDMIFYTQYPQYRDSTVARFQFYKTRWKDELSEQIDRELILADAAEYKVEVSRGDVRQEIETLFGPNIIENLDRAGLSMDEAVQMVKDDMTLKRVLMAKVNSKAFRKAIPQSLKDAYKKYAQEHMKPETWTYRVISIRSNDLEKSAQAAQIAYLALQDNVSIEEIENELKRTSSLQGEVSLNVSEEISTPAAEITDLYKDTLAALEPDSYSYPVAHKGRKDNKIVHRILYLKEIDKGGVPPLSEVAEVLRRQIIEEAMGIETQAYLDRLHRHFSISEKDIVNNLPSEFEPFTLQR